MSLYAKRDRRQLEPHFSRHMSAMTEEDLHDKADIAAELAARDLRIEQCEEAILELLLLGDFTKKEDYR